MLTAFDLDKVHFEFFAEPAIVLLVLHTVGFLKSLNQNLEELAPHFETADLVVGD